MSRTDLRWLVIANDVKVEKSDVIRRFPSATIVFGLVACARVTALNLHGQMMEMADGRIRGRLSNRCHGNH